MSNKSWRETFGFTGVKLRSEILSSGENFRNLTNPVAPHNRSKVLVAHAGQKDRIVIFGGERPKRVKNLGEKHYAPLT